jgi:DNA-binding NarL/FixJ family response regulator
LKTDPVRVAIVDDHPVLREGLASLLNHDKRVQVVGAAMDGRSGAALVTKLQPDVVLMDITMPGLNGIDATRQITSKSDTKVVCLSAHGEQSFVKAMLSAGAAGYVVKASASDELIEAILQTAAGGRYFSPCVADALAAFEREAVPGLDVGPSSGITPREREVLQLVAEGYETKDIATQLNVSAKTVLAHRESLMRKLKVDSPVALARHAFREGIAEV